MRRHRGADQLRRVGKILVCKIYLAIGFIDSVARQDSLSFKTADDRFACLHRNPSDLFPYRMLCICDWRASHGLQRHLKLAYIGWVLAGAHGYTTISRHHTCDNDRCRWKLLMELDFGPLISGIPHFCHTTLKFFAIRHRINATFACKVRYIKHFSGLRTLPRNI